MSKLPVIVFLIFASCRHVEKANEPAQSKAGIIDSINIKMTPGTEKKYSLDEIYQKYLSEDLISYIENTHPTWSVPNQNLWYPQLFNKYKTNSSLVNCISGDFDCNGKKDQALIVDKGKNGLAAVAFLRMDTGFKTVELTELAYKEGEKINYALTLYKPGRYDIQDPDLAPSDPTYVNLKCSSIGLGLFKELFEGGNDVFYWERNQLRSCVIGK